MTKGRAPLYNEKTVQITIRVPESIFNRAKEDAMETHRSLSQVFVAWIEAGLDVLGNNQPLPKE